MTIDNIEKGVLAFLDNEIMPKATIQEKAIIQGAGILGLLDIKGKTEKLLSSPLMQQSNIWTDESKTAFNADNLKKVALSFVKEKFTFTGIPIDLGFWKLELFKGFVINEQLIKTFFDYLEKAV